MKLAEYKNRNSLFKDKYLNNNFKEKELKERGIIHPSDMGSLKLLVERFMRSTMYQEPSLHFATCWFSSVNRKVPKNHHFCPVALCSYDPIAVEVSFRKAGLVR